MTLWLCGFLVSFLALPHGHKNIQKIALIAIVVAQNVLNDFLYILIWCENVEFFCHYFFKEDERPSVIPTYLLNLM